MSDDLLAFLRERLDEDEQAAKAWLPLGNPDTTQREHIARHDPARVLREVDAKRRIIERYEHHARQADEYRALGTPSRSVENIRDVLYIALLDLATAHSGHTAYRDEWKP